MSTIRKDGGGGDRIKRLCERIGIPAHAEIKGGRFAQWTDENGGFCQVDLETTGRAMFGRDCIEKYGLNYEDWKNRQVIDDNTGRFANYMNGYGAEEERLALQNQEIFIDVLQDCKPSSVEYWISRVLGGAEEFDFERALYSGGCHGAQTNLDLMNN